MVKLFMDMMVLGYLYLKVNNFNSNVMLQIKDKFMDIQHLENY